MWLGLKAHTGNAISPFPHGAALTLEKVRPSEGRCSTGAQWLMTCTAVSSRELCACGASPCAISRSKMPKLQTSACLSETHLLEISDHVKGCANTSDADSGDTHVLTVPAPDRAPAAAITAAAEGAFFCAGLALIRLLIVTHNARAF